MHHFYFPFVTSSQNVSCGSKRIVSSSMHFFSSSCSSPSSYLPLTFHLVFSSLVHSLHFLVSHLSLYVLRVVWENGFSFFLHVPFFPSCLPFFFIFTSSCPSIPFHSLILLVTFEIFSSLSSRCSCSEHCAGGVCQMESPLWKFKL